MKRVDIVHAMNSDYGRRNLYGARSAYIARAVPRSMTLLVYCRKVDPESYRPDNVRTNRISMSFRYRVRRSLMSMAGSTKGKRRTSWRGFDVLTSQDLSRLDSGTIKIFHSWEWMPETYTVIRQKHPNACIIRDVTVARRFEYRSGEDMLKEAGIVDRFLSPSDYVTKCLREWGIPDSQIVAVPFGVDTKTFRPAPSREDQPVRFAFAGKVSDRKGVPKLLSTWKRLELSEAELHLYGTVAPEIKEMIPGIAGVHTHGFVDLTKELAKNHVFVFPSPFEGSSKSVFEALACGLPVITTPNSGSVVRNGMDGLLIEPEDEEALGNAIKLLFDDRQLREKMGARARLRAENFTWDVYASRVWETYASLMKLKTD